MSLVIVGIFWGTLGYFKNDNGVNDIPNASSLIIEVGAGIAITWTVYVYSKKDSEKISQYVDEQHSSKKYKQEKNANRILFILQLIDFEVEGLFIFTKFMESDIASHIDTYERKKTLISHYARIQNLFMGMDIEADTLSDIFDPQISEQYLKAYGNIRSHSDIWRYSLDNITQLKIEIENIRKEFETLKNRLLPFVKFDMRQNYEKLFSIDSIMQTISRIP